MAKSARHVQRYSYQCVDQVKSGNDILAVSHPNYNTGAATCYGTTSRQKVLRSRMFASVVHVADASSGDATTTDRHRARDSATFVRLRENRNWIPLGAPAAVDAAIESSTTAPS